MRASSLYFIDNCELSARSTPAESHSIFSRSRPCFAGQNLSATMATPVPPRATGISNTSRTPSTARASLSSKLLTFAPKTGGCATTATFILGKSRSRPNFSEPSHLGLLSSRRTPFPTRRNSDGLFSRTLVGTVFRAASLTSSAYLAD